MSSIKALVKALAKPIVTYLHKTEVDRYVNRNVIMKHIGSSLVVQYKDHILFEVEEIAD